MYDNWLTMFSTSATFKPEKNIRRDEAAKFITVFADTIMNQKGKETASCYTFTDISAKNTLKNYIVQSCELWYIKWKNNKFTPAGNLTNEQAIAIVIRMSEWPLAEPQSNRSKNYYAKAKELGLLEGLDLLNTKKTITRGQFATLLYRTAQNYGDTNDLGSQIGNALSGMVNTMVTELISMLGIHINSNIWLNNDFIQKANICYSGAAITTETNFDMLGMNFYTKSYRQIRWWIGNQCAVYERIDAASVNVSTGQIQSALASGATQSEIDTQMAKMQSGMQAILGKDGICLYSTWTLVKNLQSELSGEFIPIPDMSSELNCTWSLYDQNQ